VDYFEIIKRAAEITWKHKYLWVLGFIAALAGSGGNTGNSLNYSSGSNDYSNVGSSFSNFASTYLVFIIFIAIVVFLLGMIIWVLSIFAQAGLVDAVGKIDKGEKTSLAESFRAGASKFWRVLGLNILLGLIVAVVTMVIVIPFVIVIVAVSSGGLDNSAVVATFVCAIIAFIVAILFVIVLAAVISVVTQYALRFIVLDNDGVISSIRRGFRLVNSYKGPTFITFLLIMLVSGLVGALFAIPGLMLGVPAAVMMIGGVAAKNIGVVALAVFGIMFASLVMAFLNGILEVYRSGIWTLTFRRIGTD